MAKKRLVLKVLHDPTVPRAQSTPTVDVVLVHGLDGDPVKTWTEPDSGVVWPQRLLPQTFPTARVLSFGYNGDMYLNRSKAGIRSNAESLLGQLKARRTEDPKRPIIFVAHCLGGLIVKQLLAFGNHDIERHGVIADSTRAILFFGTPNNAVEKKQWELLAKAYEGMERDGRLSGLAMALTRDASDLAEVNEDFVHIADRYRIFSFYETDMWRDTGACIVSEQAARMFIDGEEALPVGGDHVTMCQIDDPEDATFLDICRCIDQSLAGEPAPASAEDSSADAFLRNEETADDDEIDEDWVRDLIQSGKFKALRLENAAAEEDGENLAYAAASRRPGRGSPVRAASENSDKEQDHVFHGFVGNGQKIKHKNMAKVQVLEQDPETGSWTMSSTWDEGFKRQQGAIPRGWDFPRAGEADIQFGRGINIPVSMEHAESETRRVADHEKENIGYPTSNAFRRKKAGRRENFLSSFGMRFS